MNTPENNDSYEPDGTAIDSLPFGPVPVSVTWEGFYAIATVVECDTHRLRLVRRPDGAVFRVGVGMGHGTSQQWEIE